MLQRVESRCKQSQQGRAGIHATLEKAWLHSSHKCRQMTVQDCCKLAIRQTLPTNMNFSAAAAQGQVVITYMCYLLLAGRDVMLSGITSALPPNASALSPNNSARLPVAFCPLAGVHAVCKMPVGTSKLTWPRSKAASSCWYPAREKLVVVLRPPRNLMAARKKQGEECKKQWGSTHHQCPLKTSNRCMHRSQCVLRRGHVPGSATHAVLSLPMNAVLRLTVAWCNCLTARGSPCQGLCCQRDSCS